MDVDNIINTLIGDLQEIESNIRVLSAMILPEKDVDEMRYAHQAYNTTIKVKEDILQLQHSIRNIIDTNFKLRNALRQIEDEIDDFED